MNGRRPTAVLVCATVVGLALSMFAAAGRAEQMMVRGMGRTQGWVVATDDGELGFVDCQGRQSRLGDARVEATTGRCLTPARPIEVTGVVRSIDPGPRILRAVDAPAVSTRSTCRTTPAPSNTSRPESESE